MNRIFNTSFENSLRILILLSHATTSLTVDKITAWDFIAINGKSFGLTNVDLHGDNSFTMCEYTARRELISIAIKELVLRGLIILIENEIPNLDYKRSNVKLHYFTKGKKIGRAHV